jgi:hypothetical protein
MAPRLSIVISQAPSQDGAIADFEQALVTALMFEPGMDPMLIGHIEGVETGTTDHLCLEGIRGDFVLLGWMPAQTAYTQLARLGIYARLGNLPSILQNHSPETAPFPTPPANDFSSLSNSLPIEEQCKRRLYFVDLRAHTPRQPELILQGLKDLLQDRQTKTITLQVASKRTSSSNTTAAAPKPSPLITPVSSPPALPASSQPSPADHSESNRIPSRVEAHSSVTPASPDDNDPQWQQLDKLMDDFDSLEI